MRNISQSWLNRPSDSKPKIDPRKRYFFACEGQNTEVAYFQSLSDNRKQLGINANLELIVLERTGNEIGHTQPFQIVAGAIKKLNNTSRYRYDPKIDVLIVVFDLDTCTSQDSINNIEELIKNNKNVKFALTFPCFELFLMIHDHTFYDLHIKPNEVKLIENEVINRNRYISTKFKALFGFDPKKRKNSDKVGDLALKCTTAIEQETKLNQNVTLNNINNCVKSLTSNIGSEIQNIINDNPDIT